MGKDKIRNPAYTLMKGAIYPIIQTGSNNISHFVIIDENLNQDIVDFEFNHYTKSFRKWCNHEWVVNPNDITNSKETFLCIVCGKIGGYFD